MHYVGSRAAITLPYSDRRGSMGKYGGKDVVVVSMGTVRSVYGVICGINKVTLSGSRTREQHAENESHHKFCVFHWASFVVISRTLLFSPCTKRPMLPEPTGDSCRSIAVRV